MLSREPTQQILEILTRGQADYFKAFQEDEESATQLVAAEIEGTKFEGNVAQLASYVVVANVLLNLDETVTKE